MSDASVTTWIKQLRCGDDQAAQSIWERYLQALVSLAANRLRNSPKRKTDEEDLVLGVFEEFRQKACEGRFPRLKSRDDLWQILVQITERRAIDQYRREVAYQKRVANEAVMRGAECPSSLGSPLNGIASREPTPDEAAAFADELATMLDELDDDELRSIARDRLAGLTDGEIARKLGCSLRTVERRVQQIRKRWSERLGDAG
jgi:RNA polymerase sigma factor (sigma-70 family)